MKRIPLTALAIALSLASAGAMAQNYGDDNRGDRGSRQDRRGDSNNLRNDRARVTGVEQLSSPGNSYQHQECWNEQTNQNEGGYYRDADGRLYRDGDSKSGGNTAGTIIGAIIGGALGNQVGKGDGRKAATIAGAVIGGAVGNRSGRDDRNDGYDRYSENSGVVLRCRTVADNDYRTRYGERHGYYPVGMTYRVSYAYAGQNYQTITNTRPGRYLAVSVDVRPLQD